VSLLRAVRDRYGELRNKSRVASVLLASPQRALFGACGFGLAVFGGVYWFRRRKKVGPRLPPPSEIESRQKETAELYRAVDIALSQRGAPRPASTPPLTHVRGLVAVGHPAGETALRLTERYLRARFGKEALSLDERREFLRQARELGKAPREARAA
jgi:hypothetical protein